MRDWGIFPSLSSDEGVAIDNKNFLAVYICLWVLNNMWCFWIPETSLGLPDSDFRSQQFTHEINLVKIISLSDAFLIQTESWREWSRLFINTHVVVFTWVLLEVVYIYIYSRKVYTRSASYKNTTLREKARTINTFAEIILDNSALIVCSKMLLLHEKKNRIEVTSLREHARMYFISLWEYHRQH